MIIADIILGSPHFGFQKEDSGGKMVAFGRHTPAKWNATKESKSQNLNILDNLETMARKFFMS